MKSLYFKWVFLKRGGVIPSSPFFFFSNLRTVVMLLGLVSCFSSVSAQWNDTATHSSISSELFPLRYDSLDNESDKWLEKKTEDFEEMLLQYWEEGYEESDVAEWQEEWREAVRNPTNINELDEYYLKHILHITEYQFYHLCRYIDLYGEIMSYAELATVEGFTYEWVKNNSPYFKVGKVVKPVKQKFEWKILSHGKVTLLCRTEQVLEKQAAYLENNPLYEGTPLHMLCKLSYHYKDILKVGWTAEKDAGESFFCRSNPYGFDYNAFYLSYKNKGWLQQLLLGDYQLQFGQGLAMGMGFQMQGSDPDAVDKEGKMKPHTSSNESQFLRGVSLRIRLLPKGSLYLYVSRKSLDASISETDSLVFAEKLQYTGYHRTVAELEKEKAMVQSLYGVYYSYAWNAFRLGIGGSYLLLSSPLKQNLKFYNQFKFNDQQSSNYSLDYHWNHKKTVWFGEFAISSNAAFACVNGMVCHADDRVSFSLLHQYKPLNYHGMPDLLQSGMSLMNEQGFVVRMQCLLRTYGIFNLSWKELRYPWLKYGVDAPSKASLLRLQYSDLISKQVQYRLVYRWKNSPVSFADNQIRILDYRQSHSFSLRLQFQFCEEWQWKSRVDFQCAGVKSSAPNALAFTQSLRCKLDKFQLTIFSSLFDVDNYSLALYISEPDLLYASSSACCIGKGMRSGLLLVWKPFSHLALYAKYAFFKYLDRESIGSGATLIESNHKSLLKLQLICKF